MDSSKCIPSLSFRRSRPDLAALALSMALRKVRLRATALAEGMPPQAVEGITRAEQQVEKEEQIEKEKRVATSRPFYCRVMVSAE